VIGEEHFRTRLALLGVSEESIRYRKRWGVTVAGLPYVLETAFGIFDDETLSRRIDVGLNWSALLNSPTDAIQDYLYGARVDSEDPCCIAIHLSCPQLEFSDRGKSALLLPGSLRQALGDALERITAESQAVATTSGRGGELQRNCWSLQQFLFPEGIICTSLDPAAHFQSRGWNRLLGGFR
jgi:hypothetical protein